MNKSTNIIEMDNEIPKKNHDAIVHLNKKFIYTLGKQGPLYTRFLLSKQQQRELNATYQHSQNCLC